MLVTLDRDGMALVRADGRAELLATRPRQVYDITGAGDMVLAVVGLCVASGADYDEAAALGNVAGGLEVEKFGVALLTRDEILRDLVDHHRTEGCQDPRPGSAQSPKFTAGSLAGQTIVFTNGCFDLLHPGHVRLLREAAGAGRFPRRRPELRCERQAAERAEPPDQPGRGSRRGLERASRPSTP